jgi:hypothetical protein
MKSDVIHVTNKGAGTDAALNQADATARFHNLTKKQSMHLRLLTEEMMSLVHALTGEKEADFWIEENDGTFSLHLHTIALMNSEMRSQLLSSTTSGKNVAAKGILGKLRDLLERTMEPADDTVTTYYPTGWSYSSMDPTSMMATSPDVWSFNQYRDSITKEENKEAWDELEKSILAKIADEVTISILSDNIDMTVYKKFN